MPLKPRNWKSTRGFFFASSKAQRVVDYILNQPKAYVVDEISPTADVSA
jgi:hypothetical protein